MPPKAKGDEDADVARVRRMVLHLAKQSQQMSSPALFDIKKLPEEDASKLRQLKQILKNYGNNKTMNECVTDTILDNCINSPDVQTRLATLRLTDHLFVRSSTIRALIVEHLRDWLSYTLLINQQQYALPKQDSNMSVLKREAREVFDRWAARFAQFHDRLFIAVDYVQRLCGAYVSEAEEVDEKKEQQERLAARMIDTVDAQLQQLLHDADTCTTQIQNDMQLLQPNFAIVDGKNKKTKSALASTHALAAHGDDVVASVQLSDIVKPRQLQITPETRIVADRLIKAQHRIKKQLLPQIERILQRLQRLTCTRAGGKVVGRLTNSRSTLTNCCERITDLQLTSICATHSIVSGDEKDELNDSEWEEVVDDDMQSSSGSKKPRKQTSESDNMTVSSPKRRKVASTSSNNNNIPVLPYGLDLKYWDEPKSSKDIPQLIRNNADCHRFWRPNETELSSGDPCTSERLSVYNTRVFTYVGKEVPITHSCAAILSNGRPCGRMDRHVCPLHGKIDGVTKKEGTSEQAKSATQPSPAPWLDANLMGEIEKQTGKKLNYGVIGEKSGKDERKKEKSNRRKKETTSHERLSKVLFNPATVARVGETLDAIQRTRNERRFAHQFSYAVPPR